MIHGTASQHRTPPLGPLQHWTASSGPSHVARPHPRDGHNTGLHPWDRVMSLDRILGTAATLDHILGTQSCHWTASLGLRHVAGPHPRDGHNTGPHPRDRVMSPDCTLGTASHRRTAPMEPPHVTRSHRQDSIVTRLVNAFKYTHPPLKKTVLSPAFTN